MRALTAAAILAAAAGCSSGANPYDTSDLAYEEGRREDSVFEHRRKEVEARFTPRTHDYQGLTHELSDWRAAVLDKSDEKRLAELRTRSASTVTALEAQEKELSTYPEPMAADRLVHIRRALALERAKLAATEAKISGR